MSSQSYADGFSWRYLFCADGFSWRYLFCADGFSRRDKPLKTPALA